MEIILSILATCILGIVIYFLPLGLSVKGRWMVVFFSFVLAVLSIIGLSFLMFWQVAIIVLGVGIFLSIVLTDKFSHSVFSKEGSTSNSYYDIHNTNQLMAGDHYSNIEIKRMEETHVRDENLTKDVQEELVKDSYSRNNPLSSSEEESIEETTFMDSEVSNEDLEKFVFEDDEKEWSENQLEEIIFSPLEDLIDEKN